MVGHDRLAKLPPEERDRASRSRSNGGFRGGKYRKRGPETVGRKVEFFVKNIDLSPFLLHGVFHMCACERETVRQLKSRFGNSRSQ